MWFSTYLLWALAPIFMTPLISDFGRGTDSALLSDVLTVSTLVWVRLVYTQCLMLAPRMSVFHLLTHIFITDP